MWVDRLVKMLLPREDHFFDLLEKGANVAAKSGQLLAKLCAANDAKTREDIVIELGDVEHEADAIIHEVYDALNRTFVTPLDRSDIYSLATQLEDVVDLNHATAMQLRVHAMDDLPAGSKEMGELIAAASEEAKVAVSLLRGMKKLEEIRKHCHQLSKLEHDGDEIYRSRVGLLFKEEKNAVRLIQHKEFLEGLERALDACDHTGHALSAIVIKNG
jgi:uncharacterized protein Yka (UPF0111/DUF47 family)